ncbi:uncharacterized protein LOC130791777 isoform X3 [Actinidia eriantha]|uniref:uncharacterized protein LOC130791777 isoform X3 n=1 Tax=Actinidia eriantha TaxID=165200 RepID=UPI00258E4A38|nr:uncharacterized protein LOC130791777 isoform X3 [Actinidia eriantha]
MIYMLQTSLRRCECDRVLFLFFFLRFFENGRIEQHIGQLWLVYRVLTMFCIFLIVRFSILFSCSILTGLNFIRIEQMRSSSKYRTRSKKTNDASNSSNIIPAPPPPPQEQICYDGENLAHLLKSIRRGIEMARLMDTALPHKIWLKQQFSIGVNDVTRVLERMPPIAVAGSSLTTTQSYCSKAPAVQLQDVGHTTSF